MAGVQISAKYPPNIDISRPPIAYGDRALPRMNRELFDAELVIRQRAIMSLCDYLHDPEHIANAIELDTMENLVLLLSDHDCTIRHKSAECLFQIATNASGREAFVSRGVISPLALLFNDSEDIVRKNAHRAFAMCSQAPLTAEAIVEAKLIPIFVQKLRQEHDEILELILETLHFCLKVNVKEALDSQCMKVLTEHLGHSKENIRYLACRGIMSLSVPLEGKEQAVEDQTMHELVGLLNDKFTRVRAGAAGAIMIITVTTKGKYTALDEGAVVHLTHLINDPNSEVRLNALKALTCLSEAPKGRAALLNYVPMIAQREADPIPAVAMAATKALQVIEWKP